MRKPRLSPDDAATIKATLLHTSATQTQIAGYFNVPRAVVNNIHVGRTWSTVKPSDPIPVEQLPLKRTEAKRQHQPETHKSRHKVDTIADRWADQLRRNPDKLKALLRKTVSKWPAYKVNDVYDKITRLED